MKWEMMLEGIVLVCHTIQTMIDFSVLVQPFPFTNTFVEMRYTVWKADVSVVVAIRGV